MKQTKLLLPLIAAFTFASFHPTARQTVAEAEQPTDSTETVTSENILRMLITNKNLSQTDSRQFTIHVEPDKYDFERGQEYRIVKEFFKLGQNNPKSVYCYFIIE